MENLDTLRDALLKLGTDGVAAVKTDDISANTIEATSEPATAPTPTTEYPEVMDLNIGGRIFKVSRLTLMESGLFRHQLSERFTWTPQADGSYFMDADPDLFEHLLAFMRRPEVFPVFYTTANGFEYNLYSRLEVEAEYFQVGALRAWISQKEYLKAVVIRESSPVVWKFDQSSGMQYPANESYEKHMIPRIEKIYICPRGIGVHCGHKDRCGHACRKAQGGDDTYEEVPYVETVTIKKVVEFVGAACKLE